MLSQNQVKHITALQVKKYREEFGQFIAEGHKLVMDLINSEFMIAGIYASAGWIVTNLPMIRGKEIPVFETLPREMNRISALSTPSQILAVINIPDPGSRIPDPASYLILALDDIRDPGNLGTIIRIADWFGISTVLCSENCVDQYNPKVVQATMGSIARVKVIRCSLAETLTTLTGSITPSELFSPADLTFSPKFQGGFPVYAALLEGEPIFSQTLTDYGIILIGNESRGISPELLPFITQKLFIPSFGNSELGKAESLNASVAAAIICAEFRRRSIKLKFNIT
jgi:TrmH family RNA methyltransferase